MSQEQNNKDLNGSLHQFAQSADSDVSDVLKLINYVVDKEHKQNSPFPQLRRKRSNSSHSILSPNASKSPPRLALIDTNSNPTITQSNPTITNNEFQNYEPSPSSCYSMDFDDKKYSHIHTLPKFDNKLSTVLSLGVLDENDMKISKAESIEQDMNHIIDKRTKEECKRIMFLYNSKSGGQKALTLLPYFKAYTSLLYDLFILNSSAKEIARLSHDLITYENKIVICVVGGDGSQCWASMLIDKAIQSAHPKQISYPTIVPFPVGTGNDLSRSLGWGYEERTVNKIVKVVSDIEYCFNVTKRFSVLDRWHIQYSFPHLLEQKSNDITDEYINTFNPPLPKKFLCYLSIGYDAMITYNFAMERKENPQKFKSQLSNQTVYLRMGFKEFIKPSNPVNDSIELYIDGKLINIPKNTRSLKVININSAAAGIFFWGYLSSKTGEFQHWKRPKLNDGLIEVMATKGSSDLAKAKMSMGHAHRLGQSNEIQIKIVKTPTYLQIDGEGWCINKLCTFSVFLCDQLPTLIGYKCPRGVYHKYLSDYYTDKIKQARHRFRDVIRIKYNIPKSFPKGYTSDKPPTLSIINMRSRDDFNLNMKQNKCEQKEETMERSSRHKTVNRTNMNQKRKSASQKWKPLFANKDSWKRNKTDNGHNRKISWF